MQADAITHQQGDDHITLRHLTDAEYHPYRNQPGQTGELHQSCQRSQRHARDRTHVRHEHQQSGHDADRQGVIQPGDPQADGVEHRHDEHDRELPAQELRQHRINFRGQLAYFGMPAVRHQPICPVNHHTPVAQQIKEHHGYKDQIEDEADQAQRAGFQPSCGTPRSAARTLQMTGQQLLEPGSIRQSNAQTGLQPRCGAVLQPVQIFRQAGKEVAGLILYHRQQDQGQQEKYQPQHDDYDACRRPARQFQPLQPIGQRVADIGQNRR